MHSIKSIHQRCVLGLLCITLSVAAWAAEVHPIAVEVVGEANGAAAQMAPPAPVSDGSLYQDQQPPSPPIHNHLAQHELDAFARSVPEIVAAIKREIPQNESYLEALVPLLALLLIFGGPVALVIALAILRHRERARRERLQSENIVRLLDAGRDIPLELLQYNDRNVYHAEQNFRKGIQNVCVGTALLIFLTLAGGIKVGAIGFIVIGYGLSRLAVWHWIDSKKPVSGPVIGTHRD